MAAAVLAPTWSPVPVVRPPLTAGPVVGPLVAPLLAPLDRFAPLASVPPLVPPVTGVPALGGFTLATPGSGALAPIAGLLGEVDKVIADPLGLAGGLAPMGIPTGVPSLQQLELSALQGNINRIMSGGSFPGSDILSGVRTGFGGLFPGGVDNFIGGIVESAKANGTWRPGANPAALLGSLEAQQRGSDALNRIFEAETRKLTFTQKTSLDGDGFLTALRAQGQADAAATLIANISSEIPLPLP
jgi:hypothetical protein